MLRTISKLPKIILFCLEGFKETFFLAAVGLDLDFVLFFAIETGLCGANLQIYDATLTLDVAYSNLGT